MKEKGNQPKAQTKVVKSDDLLYELLIATQDKIRDSLQPVYKATICSVRRKK